MTDLTANSGSSHSTLAGIRAGIGLALAGLVALPANLLAAIRVAEAMKRGGKPSQHDVATLGLPADFCERMA